MAVLPPSSDGKQLFGFGLATAVVSLCVLALVLFFITVRLHREQALSDQATVLAGVLSSSGNLETTQAMLSSVEQRSQEAGEPLAAFVAGPGGLIVASSRAEDMGQTADAVESRIRSGWPLSSSIKVPLPSEQVLYVIAPLKARTGIAARLGVGAAASILLALLLFVPFFALLVRNWLTPLHRITEANREKGDKQGLGAVVPAGSVPPGSIRELVVHRNQILEVLNTKEEALSRRTNEMEILYDFSRQIGLSREAPDIPDLALSFLARSVDYDASCMLVFTETQRTLTIRSRGPLSEMLSAEVERKAVEAHYEKSGILLEGEKLETSVVVNDVRASKLDGKFRSAHWAPVTVEQRKVGIVGILGLGERQFSTDAVRFLNILAQNSSLALEKLHVMRIEETQRFRNVLENLAEGVVLVRQSGDWALATGPARQFHAEICGPEATGTADHSQQCPIGLLGLDVFHGGHDITREINRQERTFVLSGTFVRSGAAGEQGAVISIRDVTEERATQQQLFQASKLASLGELAAGVAHEVNNPLTGILGFTELLMTREDLSMGVVEGLQEIHSLARRTTQITRDLLIFARVQREGGFLAVDVSHIVRDTIKLLETSYRNLNLEISADLSAEPLVAFGDQGKIQQIVLNLAQNAKDAITMSGTGHSIRFRGFRQRDEVVVEVKDDGPGIPDRIRAKIFEPFYTTKPVGKGTGLGLAIVNRIVEEHKGKLILESEEGRGTLFRIHLPAASEEDVAKMPERASAPQPKVQSVPAPAPIAVAPKPPSPVGEPTPLKANGNPIGCAEGATCIVVLDDEETVLKFVQRTLQKEGVVVHTTSDPETAFDLVKSHSPQLLFLDFRMPEVTGEEFYNRVIGQDSRMADRVVFLTGDATGDEIQGFLKATGAPALTKPIGIRDLRDFVEKKLAGAPNSTG